MDTLQAEKAVRDGAIAGTVAALSTLVLAWTRWGERSWENNLGAIINVVVILLLAHAVWRRSVLGAALLLGFHGLDRIAMFGASGSSRGLFMFLLFAYLYLRALRGARALRPLTPEDAPAGPLLPWWAYYVVPPLVVLLVVVVLGP